MAESRVALEDHQKRVGVARSVRPMARRATSKLAANQRAVVAPPDCARRGREARRPSTRRSCEPRQDASEGGRAARGSPRTRPGPTPRRPWNATRRSPTSVDAALAATEAAQQLLPGDATLSEAAQKLKAKSDELQIARPRA